MPLLRSLAVSFFTVAIGIAFVSPLAAQPRLLPSRTASSGSPGWQPAQTRVADTRASDAGAPLESRPAAGPQPSDVALDNSQGQVWREYDLRPYTTRVQGVETPENAIKDWILRETGTEVWFGETVALLSVGRQRLRVYHTPEIQKIVSKIVEKFVASRPEPHALSMRLVTLQSPSWRAPALPMMEPVEVHSPGVDAWLVSRENAVLLMRHLKKRADFHQHSAGKVPLFNGQSYTLNQRQPRRYVKSVRSTRDPWPAHHPEAGEISEGYTLQLSALFDEQAGTLDAVIRCHVDQIEQLVPVTLELPGLANQRQRMEVQVPQLVSWRLHERFVWPDDKVLVLSCGVVASPGPRAASTALGGLPLPPLTGGLTGGARRADALLMLENAGVASQSMLRTDRSARTAPNYHGRY